LCKSYFSLNPVLEEENELSIDSNTIDRRYEMFGFGVPELCILVLVVVPIILSTIALVDILRCEFTGQNKLVWVIVIILVPILGFFLYCAIGQKQKVHQSHD